MQEPRPRRQVLLLGCSVVGPVDPAEAIAMRCVSVLVLLGPAAVCPAADLTNLPANTFVEIKYTNVQPPGAGDDNGSFARQGWNKIVYDPDGKRVLLYDRWI